MLQIILLAIAVLVAAPSAAETIGGNPGPQYNYVCPDADNKPALDCYFDAVGHLYTMCKHVKSIEIIEFGYEHSTDGTNAAKSESCVAKQKLSMTRPYQAALKSAIRSAKAVDDMRELHEQWLKALAELPWKPGEADDAYKARTMHPYESFAEHIVKIRTDIQLAAIKPEKKTVKKVAAKPAKASSKSKAAN